MLTDPVQRIVHRYQKRLASRGQPLDRQTRQRANVALIKAGLDGNTYFDKAQQGYAKAVDVIAGFGMELATIPNSFVFTRPEGKVDVDLAWKNPTDSFSPEEVPNSVLVVTFHQMDSGRFEVIAYLS